jgi:hypothetical protein
MAMSYMKYEGEVSDTRSLVRGAWLAVKNMFKVTIPESLKSFKQWVFYKEADYFYPLLLMLTLGVSLTWFIIASFFAHIIYPHQENIPCTASPLALKLTLIPISFFAGLCSCRIGNYAWQWFKKKCQVWTQRGREDILESRNERQKEFDNIYEGAREELKD